MNAKPESCAECGRTSSIVKLSESCPFCQVAAPLPAAPAPTDEQTYLNLSMELVSALKRLSFAAQTSGGTAGRDDELVAAIGQAKEALSYAAVSRAIDAADVPLPAEQAGELPPLPERSALTLTGPDKHRVIECLWDAPSFSSHKEALYTVSQMYAFRAEGIADLAARQAAPINAAIRITNKQQADPKLAGPGATAHERFLYAQLGWLQSTILAARPAPTEDEFAKMMCDANVTHIACMMGNMIYNLAQKKGHILTDADCEMFNNLREQWDAARQAPDSRDAALEEADQACRQVAWIVANEGDTDQEAGANKCRAAVQALKSAAAIAQEKAQ